MTGIKTTKAKQYEELENILGRDFVNEPVSSPYDYIKLSSKGLNASTINNFRKYFDLSLQKTAYYLNTSEPSLYRWIKAGKVLNKNLGIKIFELTNLFLYGSEVFGSKENFFKWLKIPNAALGGMEPEELIEVPNGMAKVRDLLGRIEHGVYS